MCLTCVQLLVVNLLLFYKHCYRQNLCAMKLMVNDYPGMNPFLDKAQSLRIIKYLVERDIVSRKRHQRQLLLTFKEDDTHQWISILLFSSNTLIYFSAVDEVIFILFKITKLSYTTQHKYKF